MASSLDKRLQRIEELLSQQINTPVATIWLAEGQDPDAVRDEMIAAGKVAAADRSRIKLIRWQTAEERGISEPKGWDMPDGYGPPVDKSISQNSELLSTTPVDPSPEAVARYQDAIARQEAEDTADKLAHAAKLFDRSIA